MEHNIYDKSFKELFSRPEIVKDFLTGFVDQDFINNVDFSRIDTPNKSFVTKAFKDRHTDMIVKLNLIDGLCAYVYILFEFESTPDRYMSLRMLQYILLFYEELIKTKQVKDNDLFPPVFPVLIYTNKDEYKSPLRLEDLIAKPYKRLIKYIPKFEHYALTLQGLTKEKKKLRELSRLDNNLLAALFSFFIAGNKADIQEMAEELSGKLNYGTDLGKFFIMWFRKYCKHKNLKIDIKICEGGEVMLETVFEEVKMEEKFNIAKKALAKGYDIEEIADLTDLPVEEIQKLMKKN